MTVALVLMWIPQLRLSGREVSDDNCGVEVSDHHCGGSSLTTGRRELSETHEGGDPVVWNRTVTVE